LIAEHSGAEFKYICTAKPDIGKLANKFTAKVFLNGSDITQYYLIEYVFGTITTERIAITVKAGNAYGSYDPLSDTPLTCNSYTYTGTLLDGHKIVCDVVGSRPLSSVGETVNEIKNLRIVTDDEREIDVTKYYALSTISGVIKVSWDI
jgi:hypothetical protein